MKSNRAGQNKKGSTIVAVVFPTKCSTPRGVLAAFRAQSRDECLAGSLTHI